MNMETDTNQINKSYFWAWDYRQGWNYTTFFSFFNDFDRAESNLEYIEFVAIALLSLCSFLVNFSLIVFFLTKKELRGGLHIYTVSLMISSIILIPFALLIGITRLSLQGWMFGNVACKTTLYVLLTTAFVKIWLMTLISVDRYLRVVHSHNRYISQRLSVILTLTAWILPAATVAGMVYPNSQSLGVAIGDDNITICTVVFEYNPTIPNALVYFCSIFAVEFFLPTTIMIVCYVLIMRRIKKSTTALMKHTNNQKKPHGIKFPERSLRANLRRRKTTIILISIMVLFLVMWLPLFGLLAVITFDQIMSTFKLTSRWVVGQVCILLLNTLVEPFLYSFTTSKVRRQLKHSIESISFFKQKTGAATASSIDDTWTQNYSAGS